MTARTKRTAIAGALCATLLCMLPVAAPAGVGDKIRQQQQKIDQTKQRLDQKRGEAQSARDREADLQRQLDEATHGIAVATARLTEISGEVRWNERRLEWNKVQLDAAEATLRRHNDALNRRLIDAYENGDLAYFSVLFHATSFSDFVERWDDIRYLVAANQRTIRERREAERAVASVQANLLGSETELRELEQRETQTQAQLTALASEREGLVAVADEQRRNSETQVVQLEEVSQEESSALADLIVEKQREEEARRRAEAEARRRASQLSGETEPGAPPEPAEGLGGPSSLLWPVSGPITSGFGMRLDPVSGLATRMHEGIDIAAASGTTIAAAAGGRVIVAGWNDGGYGNMVVIDHGGGISTVYGHCSQVFVSAGQDVQRGQAIAAVGSTGHSTGPHLHFEVRVNGKPVDPTSRLR